MRRPGRLVSVNTSDGGVPKHPIPECAVGTGGLDGDRQRDLRYHGGPDRAVCLYSADLLEALRREGHAVAAGALGENLTVEGLDWDAVVPGATLRVGPLRLEVTKYSHPCANLTACFVGGEITRVSQKVHPGWSRVYARVLEGGVVRVGDRVSVRRPPAAKPPSGPPATSSRGRRRSPSPSR